MEFHTHRLANGIKVIHKVVDQEVAHFSWMISVGSRHEKKHQFGLAHFIEHGLFKGTKKRNMRPILSRMENVGGELNAYTTKEETYIYSSFLASDFERAVELIADIVKQSTFPKKEIEKEKIVILDEINSYKDNPSEQIFDDFEELIFKKSDLGKNILGDKKSVLSFDQESIFEFIDQNYSPDKMLLSSVGNSTPEEVFELADRYFSDLKTKKTKAYKPKLKAYKPRISSQSIAQHQSHYLLGCRTFGAKDERCSALILLNNILGGPGMNTRLNLNIREKHGLTYSIESNCHFYRDAGVFSIYFGADKKHSERIKMLIFKACRKLMTKTLSEKQLKKAKKQLLGQFYIAQENNCNLMLSMAKSLSVHGKVDTVEDIQQNIEAITAKDIQDLAKIYLDPKQFSTLEYTT
ncbi:MAG: M16 family metallopeptidase [Flavobacteriales bacterium]